MKSVLEQISLPFILLLGYFGYCFSKDPSFADSIIMGVLATLYGFKLYMDHIKKSEPNLELEKKITQLEDKVSGIALGVQRVNVPKQQGGKFGW